MSWSCLYWVQEEESGHPDPVGEIVTAMNARLRELPTNAKATAKTGLGSYQTFAFRTIAVTGVLFYNEEQGALPPPAQGQWKSVIYKSESSSHSDAALEANFDRVIAVLDNLGSRAAYAHISFCGDTDAVAVFYPES